MDDEMELVRRGFDPGQVQHLVGQLASELRALAAENDRLRARLAEAVGGTTPVLTERPQGEAATEPDRPANGPASIRTASPIEPTGPQVGMFDQWSRETDHLMQTARDSIAAVTEHATAQAAAAVAAGETAALAIRQRAQLDADALLAEASRRAQQLMAVAAAERAAGEAEARVMVERARVDVADLQSQLASLRAKRAAMLEQLGTARTHLHHLLALVEADDESDVHVDAQPGVTAATMPDATDSGPATDEGAAAGG